MHEIKYIQWYIVTKYQFESLSRISETFMLFLRIWSSYLSFTFATHCIGLNSETACSLHHFPEWDL